MKRTRSSPRTLGEKQMNRPGVSDASRVESKAPAYAMVSSLMSSRPSLVLSGTCGSSKPEWQLTTDGELFEGIRQLFIFAQGNFTYVKSN